MDDLYTILVLVLGLVGIVFAFVQSLLIGRKDEGSLAMKDIASHIREGAEAFLNRELRTITVVAAVLAVLIALSVGWTQAVSFIVGVISSALAGYVGILTSVKANVRTTAEAVKGGIKPAFNLAFRGGTVMGMFVVGIALFGISGLYWLFGNPLLMVGYMFGASLVSLMVRVGGGIFTKGADVGADMVGKVEIGIPEDDPRNPGVIADNVGDNVGDCAGMGADLFETYAVTLVSAMLLGKLLPSVFSVYGNAGIQLPLLIGGIAIVTTIVGIPFVKLTSGWIMGAFYKGLAVTAVASIIGYYLVIRYIMAGALGLLVSSVIGIAVMVMMYIFAEFFTSYQFNPVRDIAKKSETGAGTNIISGLANGHKATIVPVLVIVTAILGVFLSNGVNLYDISSGSFYIGIYGIAIAATAMMSLAGMVVSIDTFGPITDNAGGIAEMANLDEKIRAQATDPLDAVGNITKATTKAYAIASAALAALSLFVVFDVEMPSSVVNGLLLFNPLVVAGLFIGAMVPFLFTSYLLNAVGVAAYGVVEEIRRQFREIKGIMEGKAKPDYAACVDITTKVALRQLALPAIIATGGPLLVGFILGPLALSGYMFGAIITGFPVAIWMTTGGAAWDNAKKYIEKGNFGGRGSEAHKASVVGDTVGDATKDTAGPSVNPLIKVIITISVLFAPLILMFHLL